MPPKTEENATQGSNQRLTAPLNQSSIPVSNTALGRSFHSRTWAGRKDLSKLGRSIPLYFKLQWMSCRRSSKMSDFSRSRWRLTEQTVVRVRINLVQHTQPSHTTSMTQWQETLIGMKPGYWIHLALKKLNVTFSSWPLHLRTRLEDLEKKLKIATK